MTTDRFGGRLVQTYSYTVPADPGWAQHDRHKGEGDEPNTRDDAPAGGGWQPAAWDDQARLNVLPGYDDGKPRSHHGGVSHRGDLGRGAGRDTKKLDSLDHNNGGDSPGLLLGAGGAANGGLRAEGSAAWMSPGASRRRADGGIVTRAAGFLLGHRHVPITGEHRQALHMNKPTIRGVRQKIIVKGSDPNGRPAGPVQPKGHSQISPYTYDETTPAYSAPSVVGSDWAL